VLCTPGICVCACICFIHVCANCTHLYLGDYAQYVCESVCEKSFIFNLLIVIFYSFHPIRHRGSSASESSSIFSASAGDPQIRPAPSIQSLVAQDQDGSMWSLIDSADKPTPTQSVQSQQDPPVTTPTRFTATYSSPARFTQRPSPIHSSASTPSNILPAGNAFIHETDNNRNAVSRTNYPVLNSQDLRSTPSFLKKSPTASLGSPTVQDNRSPTGKSRLGASGTVVTLPKQASNVQMQIDSTCIRVSRLHGGGKLDRDIDADRNALSCTYLVCFTDKELTPVARAN